MLLLAVFAITTGIVLLTIYLVKLIKFLKMVNKIPDSSGLIPFIGILPQLIGADLHDLYKIFIKYEKTVKGVGKFWMGHEVLVLVNSPDNMQKVLNSKECLDKPAFFKYFGIERGSLFGSLEAWRVHRKVLNPGFNPQLLKSFVSVFDRKSRNLIKSFHSKCDQEEFDVFPQMSAFFLDTILTAALDLDVDILNDSKKNEYVEYFDDYYSAITARIMKPWLYFEPFYKMSVYYKMEMDGRTKGSLKFTDEILERARKNYDANNNVTHKNAIKLLIDPKYKLDDEEIKQEITTLLVAAQDSTTIVISTALLLLAMHKNVQQKVIDELHEVFPAYDDPIDFDILNRLPYLEQTIKETLRLFPISAFTLRTTAQNVEIDNYLVPAGCIIVLSVFTLHRNKEYWGDDADKFVPERFEAERIKSVHPYAYVPFSGGPRHCIGSKYAMLFMKTCLANFLRNYEIDTTLKYDDLDFRVSVTLKINQPTKISLKRRKY